MKYLHAAACEGPHAAGAGLPGGVVPRSLRATFDLVERWGGGSSLPEPRPRFLGPEGAEIRRPTIPGYSGAEVLRHAQPVLVQNPDVVHRRDVAPVGCLVVPA